MLVFRAKMSIFAHKTRDQGRIIASIDAQVGE